MTRVQQQHAKMGERRAMPLRVGVLCGLVALSTAQRRLPEHVSETEPSFASKNGAVRELEADEQADDASIDDRVTAPMPGLSEDLELVHHAGRITLDDSSRNKIFYWHFAADKNPETAPLVVWLNGGPGCSSMQGLFLGVSPFQIEKGGKISVNEHSWHHHANLLFIDQPVGTGMSNTRGNDYRTDEEAVAKDFYAILRKFFALHPEYVKPQATGEPKITRDLYIFGESHAGRYIPEFSDYIVTQNKLVASDADGVDIRLAGVGIGNGWVHPFIQYDYTDFAHGLGLVTFGQVRSLKAQFVECQNELTAGNYLSASCFYNMNSILEGLMNRKASSSKALNFYDVRHYVHSVGAYPAKRSAVVDYLNRAEVRKILHANTDANFRYSDCSDEVYDGLRSFDGVSTLHLVDKLLEGGLRVLFYNGQWDMMCNHYSTERLLLHLKWNGSGTYQDAQKFTWSAPGRSEAAGFAQEGGNLTYTVITGAGHMVPMDVPDIASEMVRRFINSEAFDDTKQQVKSLSTNSSNLETVVCPVEAAAMVKGNSVDLTWLWVAVVLVVVGSLLVFCVSILCRRTRKARHSEHSIIEDESDDDDASAGRSKGKIQDDEEDEQDTQEDTVSVSIRSRGSSE